MLRDVGCRYVLVGHSERRQLFGEHDALVARKFVAAQAHGLTPVLCVGETLEEREAGRTGDVVSRQLDAVLAVSGIAAFDRAVVAYEPVWAIGTGRNATPEQAQDVHALIRGQVGGAGCYNRRICEDPVRRQRQGVERTGALRDGGHRRRPRRRRLAQGGRVRADLRGRGLTTETSGT